MESQVGMLEALLAGGIWLPARVAQAGLGEDGGVCPRCSASAATDFHVYWECPANAAIDDEGVRNTEYLATQAAQGLLDRPCLWLRGLVPESCVVVHSAVADDLVLHLLCDPPAGRS